MKKKNKKTLVAIIGPNRNTKIVVNRLNNQFDKRYFDLIWFTWKDQKTDDVSLKKITLQKPEPKLKGNGFFCHSSKNIIFSMFYSLHKVALYSTDYTRIIRLRSDTLLSESSSRLLCNQVNIFSKSIRLPKPWLCDHLFSLSYHEFFKAFGDFKKIKKALFYSGYNPEITISILFSFNSKIILNRYCDFTLSEEKTRLDDPPEYRLKNFNGTLSRFVPYCDMKFDKSFKIKLANFLYKFHIKFSKFCLNF